MLKTALVATVIFIAGAATVALGQSNGSGFTEARNLAAYSLGAGETVNMDGNLDDAVWDHTQVATDFRQVQPDEGAGPSQPTTFRIAYSPTTLYVAIEVTETRPGFYTANVRHTGYQRTNS